MFVTLMIIQINFIALVLLKYLPLELFAYFKTKLHFEAQATFEFYIIYSILSLLNAEIIEV